MGAIGGCCFSCDKIVITPLTFFLDFNVTAHFFSLVISPKLSHGVSPRLMMSQFSITYLVRNRLQTSETQIRYKKELKMHYQ